jgi:hypothetical protein
MSSKRQKRSNWSTGPRTDRGKSRSRANAVRHGLSAKFVHDPGLIADVDELAKLIAREYGRSINTPHVRAVAEAQVMIVRARQARARLVENVDRERSTNESGGIITTDNRTDGRFCDPELLGTFATIDRYETLALYRRQQGLKGLILEMSCP